MTDWKAVALGRGLNIPANELERLKTPLDSLEKVFGPLAETLSWREEPATTFSVEGPAE